MQATVYDRFEEIFGNKRGAHRPDGDASALDADGAEQGSPEDLGTDQLLDAINRALSGFPRTHQEVVRKRWGLMVGAREKQSREVARELGLSREEVRRIEREVMGQLSKDSHLRSLAKTLSGA